MFPNKYIYIYIYIYILRLTIDKIFVINFSTHGLNINMQQILIIAQT